MSAEQRENLDAILRQSAFPADIDVNEQRRLLRELISAQPLPAEVTVTATTLGGVPAAEITVDGVEPRHLVLYFHGGVYVLGDAFQAAGLAAQVGRRTRARVISVDYRLAPEHPYPAAVDDALAAYEALLHNGTAPSDIAFAGESAGGGLAVATLVNARDHGLALPAAAFVMSPYADLTLAGTTMDTKHAADPLLSRESLQSRVPDYTSGQDASLGLISPIFADLSGLPPLIIQAGTHEVLLDDAIRLARQAATADVAVTLDITPGVPHVFQAYSAGSHPKGQVNPHALELLKRLDYDVRAFRSKAWDEFAAPGAPPLDFVITVCDSAAGEVCPIWPGQPMTAHWGMPDPAAMEGTPSEIALAFAETYRMLNNRIGAFANLKMSGLDRLSLQSRIADLGKHP